MPLPKQTTDLIFSLQALVYRIRQLIKERRGYSKTKAREVAKLLKDGREDFARIKTEDMIANDNLIAALEIIELHCEQLQVRANILDHIAFGQKRKSKPPVRRRGNQPGSSGSAASTGERGSGGGGGGGWGLWKILGLGGGAHAQGQRSGTGDAVAAAGAGNTSPDGPKLESHTVAEESAKSSDETPKVTEPEVYIDRELDRAAGVIFYSYARLPRDVPGLPELRVKLMQRWGNDFASRVQDDDDPPVNLPEDLVERLRVQKASPVLVEKYLKEIARSHGIPWHQDEDNTNEDEAGGQNAEDDDELPEFIGEQTSRVDNQAAKKGPIKALPDDMKALDAQPSGPDADSDPPAALKSGPEDSRSARGVPEVDELARRFAALKR
ncbi:Vacuolar protein sorting-associated protein ist1 [Emydomyces testavorans]|uniref:Vacuolar protein sorting-associated protein ist1 n=1 Tax=Emydomyces testavorans TaxID=2070801 RepID=A0AAF0DBI8_9EURO|nr:Vacuolar protein sorting-associated protein ist1 [Emydomyces testavorans]